MSFVKKIFGGKGEDMTPGQFFETDYVKKADKKIQEVNYRFAASQI